MKLGTQVGLGPGHIMLDGDPAPPPQRGRGGDPQFLAHICYGQMAAGMPLGMEIGLSPDDFVLDGDPAPPPKKGGGAPSPIFGPFLLWLNVWMHQDAIWYGGRPHPRGLCVRWRPSPFPKRGRSRQFLAHVYCGQTAGWIKMPLAKVVGVGLRDIVLNGDPAPLP